MKSGKLARLNLRALNVALASAVALGGLGVGFDAYAATTSGTANATVVTPIAITAANDLRFGAFSASTTGQTVTINAQTGDRTGTVTRLVTPGGPASVPAFGAGTFNVTGDSASALTYSITLPSTAVTITRSGGSETMTVSAFTSFPSGTGTLSSGSQTLSVGATLTTTATPQASGTYSGSYSVTVEYQ